MPLIAVKHNGSKLSTTATARCKHCDGTAKRKHRLISFDGHGKREYIYTNESRKRKKRKKGGKKDARDERFISSQNTSICHKGIDHVIMRQQPWKTDDASHTHRHETRLVFLSIDIVMSVETYPVAPSAVAEAGERSFRAAP